MLGGREPHSALSPSGSSFGVAPIGIHHLFLSNLTTSLGSCLPHIGPQLLFANLQICSEHKNVTELNWTDLQQADPVTRSVTAGSLVTPVSVTIWLAASKLGRLVLSQFVCCEHSHWTACVQNCSSRTPVQFSSVHVHVHVQWINQPASAVAGAAVRQGNRYGGVQLSADDATTALCYCGLTVGRHGVSRRCTVRCPGSDVDTQVCGNLLANTVLYLYRGRLASILSIHSTEYVQCMHTCRWRRWWHRRRERCRRIERRREQRAPKAQGRKRCRGTALAAIKLLVLFKTRKIVDLKG